MESSGVRYGLDRIEAMLKYLDYPHRAMNPRVLVVGTNGKGSVAATLSAIATAAGKRPGLFTSPHLIRATERFRIDDRDMTWEEFDDVGGRVLSAIDNSGVPLSFFEAMVTTALLAFRDANCDVAILEAGLGGRRDGTRPTDPTHAVLTGVSLDHTKTLGPTLNHIATEKLDVFADGAQGVVALPKALVHRTPENAWRYGQEVTWRKRKHGGLTVKTPETTLRLPPPALHGGHQRRNAALAAATAHRMGFEETDIANGLLNVRWPARMQLLACNPDTWLDGAHNPAAVHRLLQTMDELNIAPGYTLVFGAHPFKNTRHLLQRLSKKAETVITTTADRLTPAEDLAQLITHPNITITPNPGTALKQARAHGRPVVIAGSLYLAGAILHHLEG